jgi:predicted acyl esterase
VNVHLPGPADRGPYATVVEYSGYDPANPNSTQPASGIAQMLGYATVGVNLRGTGCSGGAWDYFEALQSLDGYDAVETVAAQPWVRNGRVGMVGISYPGITQLFVAATRPPHLAAITPLSVIDDTYRGVLYPGGILNSGFAVAWARDRQHDARPAGQPWARRRIQNGDATCAANQALRLQTPDVLAEIKADRFYVPARLDHLDLDRLVSRITVPTFLAGAVEDEQTGGRWPELISHFPAATKLKATITNGTHIEGFAPSVALRWGEFLDFYVAQQIPSVPSGVRADAPVSYASIVGTPLTLPPDRFTGDTDYAAALARYEAEPRVRVLFDNGAGTPTGAPIPGFEASFPSWPPPGVQPTTWYLRSGGRLDRSPPPAGDHGSDGYRYDPGSVLATDATAQTINDIWDALPTYDWQAPPAGDALTYTSDPLPTNVVLTGPASVDLWLRTSAPDTDLEVALTEVRPDGQEMYVQSGWLRASHRTTLEPDSTPLDPRYSDEQAQVRPMPKGQYAPVRVPLFPIVHAFRAGSRLRIVVQAPGGNRPLWAFADLPASGSARNEVARSAMLASKIVLPVNPSVTVPTPLPPCPSLRGEPCRAATPAG